MLTPAPPIAIVAPIAQAAAEARFAAPAAERSGSASVAPAPLGFSAGAAPSPPRFSTPVTIARGLVRDGEPPGVAVNAAGDALVAFNDREGRVVVRRLSAAGAASPAQTISAGYGSDAEVALAADGSAAAIWARYAPRGGRRFLELATAKPGGRFGRPRQLVSVVANITGWRVLAAGGRFAAVWWQGVPGHDHAIRYVVGSGPVRTLARVDGNGGVGAAVSPTGDVVATWLTPGAAQVNGQAGAATLAPDADRFGPTQVISADTQKSMPGSSAWPSVFAGPGGVAVAYTVDGVLPWTLRIAPRTSSGVFAPATVTSVDNNEAGTIELDGPDVALPSTTPPVAVWAVTRERNGESEDDPVAGRIDAATAQPDGTFSPPVHITPAGEFPTWPLSVAATSSAAIVLWETGDYNRERIRYAIGTPFTAPRTLATGAVRGVNVAASGDHVITGWLAKGAVHIARLD